MSGAPSTSSGTSSRAPAAPRVFAGVAAGSFLAVMVLVIALLVFVNDGATYGADPAETSANFPLPSAASVALGCLVALALACLTACASLLRRRPSFGRREFLAVMVGVSGLVLVIQIVLVRSLYAVPGWDAGTILEYARWQASGLDATTYYGGDVNTWVVDYLDLYPNNALLTGVLTGCYRLGRLIGTDGLYLACVLGALCVGAAGLLGCLLVERVTGSHAVAVVAYALYTLLFSLSPWVSVAYSDTFATLFVAATLYAGAHALEGLDRSRDVSCPRCGARWLVVGALAFLGYLVKPTVLIVLMALVVVGGVRVVAGRGTARDHLTSAGLAAAGLALAASLVFGVVSPAVRAAMGASGDASASLGMSHFLMMGQNDETTGSYLQADVDFARSVSDPSERASKELAAALERIAGRGVSGNLDFYARKVLYSFGDGTFSWAGEAGDGFFQATLPAWGPLSEALRSLVYRAAWQAGADRGTFRTLAQITWCAVLVLATVGAAGGLRAALLGRRRGPDGKGGRPEGSSVDPIVLAAMLAVVGLFVYLLLFECRARYLYCFGPAMMLCSAVGLKVALRRLLALPALRPCPNR